MSLAATLAASGARPASFLPAIKCSSCGDEIEIASMGDHICGKAPPSPHAAPASFSNPFTIRQLNANGQLPQHMPSAPSPLQQQDNKPATLPKTRVRAPTLQTNQLPAPKAVRPPPPRINPDAANMPFLAPRPPRSESPISPAISVRSGSSQGSRPPPIRSQTSPAPRLFDMRPPSPELSVNLDCAFPPFAPMSAGSGGSGSRPGTANGRKTPTPSERAPSRGSSRHDSSRSGVPSHKAPWDVEPRSPINGGENVVNKMNTLKSGPFDTSRRPSQGSIPQSQDRRRPSLSSIKLGHEPPPIPSEPMPRPSTSQSNASSFPGQSAASRFGNGQNPAVQKRGPPPRPERPTEEVLSPCFLDHFSAEPSVDMPSTFSPSQPPVPTRSNDRSRTFPIRQESDETAMSQDLHKAPSEPQLRGRDSRPTLTAAAQTMPSNIPQATHMRQRSQSRSGPRQDHRLQDAPPVPKPVQQHRHEKTHAPSESGSSTASSVPSLGNSHSSTGGPSPVGSAASSVDVLSSLTFTGKPYGDDEEMRVQALNVKAQRPGLRAEQPRARSPPRNFARTSPPREVVLPQQSSPTLPALASPPLPLESPMDPLLQARPIERSATEPWQPSPAPQPRPAPTRTMTVPEPRMQEPVRAPAPPMPPLTIPQPSPADDDYDPYRAISPVPGGGARTLPKPATAQSRPFAQQPPRPASPQTLAPTQYRAPNSGSSLRSRSPQPVSARSPADSRPSQRPRSPQPGQSQRPRSPLPVPAPPPVPQEAARAPPLTRRGTSVKPTCRGCNQIIEGKSVKAADGRLTGRWHKACFTCRACEQPFITADFYVIANHPYCEQHYHEENGSLCHGCHRGIEGQYLETTSSSANGSVEKKFHPRCFTCCDCRQVLADDYFEISGKVYCERHALAAMRGQARMAGPGSAGGGLSVPDRKALTAERRTTRLLMM